MDVAIDLIKKFNVPVPRYTSYPPATHFGEIAASTIAEGLEKDRESKRDLSLYFHLPFCSSLCWYCGCTTVITTKQSQSSDYLRYLDKELSLRAPLVDTSRPVAQIHLGGGTPTFLTAEELAELGKMMRRYFQISDKVEASVEIDPRHLTPDRISALREAGFSRASLGVQDFNPAVQKAVHRIQPREMTIDAFQSLRAAGFHSINLDLMYGLPLQTEESFFNTLNEVISLKPDRLAVFNYAHVPWMKPAQKLLTALPSPDTKLAILKLTIETLNRAGYIYIGVDHFAHKDDQLARAQREKSLQRNFQGYSTCRDTDIHGFGMSSISQGAGLYWQNEKELPAYYELLDQGKLPIVRGYVMTGDDKIRSEVIMRLMCDLSLSFDQLSDELGIEFESYFADELASLSDLEDDGVVTRHPGGLEVTELGRLFIRNIAVRFDAYQATRTELQFSRSV